MCIVYMQCGRSFFMHYTHKYRHSNVAALVSSWQKKLLLFGCFLAIFFGVQDTVTCNSRFSTYFSEVYFIMEHKRFALAEILNVVE